MLLFAFVTFAEGYLGVRPTVALWSQLCHLKSQGAGDVLSPCGASSIYAHKGIG